ncbi:hypothetical protein RRK80_004696, partial [Salmonella enterica]|nr:hypothetical protein [Salmonella enterica]
KKSTVQETVNHLIDGFNKKVINLAERNKGVNIENCSDKEFEGVRLNLEMMKAHTKMLQMLLSIKE